MGRRGRRPRFYRREERSRFSAPVSLSAHPIIPRDLPVWRKESDLVNIIDRNQISVVTGNTGCGKTTQVPKMILDHWPKALIVVTQPRRLAAISAAKRVANELHCAVGDVVGYHVHGDRCYSHQTQVLYVTIGLFIQELVALQAQPPWSHVIIDEVHERSMEIDFSLVLLKHLLTVNKQLKLVLMSATIDSKVFANYYSREEMTRVNSLSHTEEKENEDPWIQSKSRFLKDFDGPAPVINVGAEMFKVKKVYLEEIVEVLGQCHLLPEHFALDNTLFLFDSRAAIVTDISQDIYRLAAHVIKAQHTHQCFSEEAEAPGSFLVFLPGLHEINSMSEAILKAFDYQTEQLELIHLHSAVPEAEHFRVMDSVAPGIRRIILSTNIAESSLTLGDVRFVLDFGYSKEITYSSRTFTESLNLVWCCKAAMKQRAGRAGRVANGFVFRLLPKTFHKEMRAYGNPEMKRCPLDKLILKAKQLNLGSAVTILSKAIEPPDRSDIRKTESFLKNVGALTPRGDLTWLGQVAADMPCNLNLTRLCLFGGLFGCMSQAVHMAAILSQDKSLFLSYTASNQVGRHEYAIFQSKMRWADGLDSDLLCALNVYEEWLLLFGKGMIGEGESGNFQVRRFAPSYKERGWCTENFLSPTVLRDVTVSAQELKRRLSFFNISTELISSRVSLQSTDRHTAIMTLKLCIAGAFVGRYMSSRYGDDRIRRNASNLDLVTINACSDIVVEEDLMDMVQKYATTSSVTVSLAYNRAEIAFGDQQNFRQMQMFMWTGLYSQRYRQGDFVVIKRTIRKDNTLIRMQSVDDRTRDYYLRQLTKQDWKRMKTFNLDPEQYKDETHQVEVICLGKPEHAYKLEFSDMKTYLDILVEEDSINSVVFEREGKMERNHLLVASQYILKGQQNGRTYAVHTTHFQPSPMLPQLLALSFEHDVSLVKDEQGVRYGGVLFHDSGQVSDINYEFRRRDLEEINQIRSIISQGLNSPNALEAAGRSNLMHLLLSLLSRQRLKAVKGGLSWSHPDSDIVEIEEGGVRDIYLRPIPALDVKEDARQWDPDWESIRQAEISSMVTEKQNLLSDLERRVRLIEMKDAELICASCKLSLGFAKFVKCTRGSVYAFTPLYGAVQTISRDQDQNPLGDKTFPSPPDSWIACLQRHVFGWQDENQSMMLFLDAPVAVLMPTLTEVEFSADLFSDGAALLTRLLDSYLTQRRAIKVDLRCQVCEVELDSEKAFVTHMFKDRTHKEQVARLKADFLC